MGLGPSARDVLLSLFESRDQIEMIIAVGINDLLYTDGLKKHLSEKYGVVFRDRVTRFGGHKTLLFSDGSSSEVDAIIWTTGYTYDWPFLEKGVLRDYGDDPTRLKSFGPLFLFSVHVDQPSLLFVGLNEGHIVAQYSLEWNAILVASVILRRHATPLTDLPSLHAA